MAISIEPNLGIGFNYISHTVPVPFVPHTHAYMVHNLTLSFVAQIDIIYSVSHTEVPYTANSRTVICGKISETTAQIIIL